jgi:hypothetical protein
MRRFVLVARPHGNIRQRLWQLKREEFDWSRDDASMALPEGFICGWFNAPKSSISRFSKNTFSEHAQQILSRHAENICAILPGTFHFSSIIQQRGQRILKLDDEFDVPKLKTALERFGQDIGLKACADALSPYKEAQRGIWLGSGNTTSAPARLSFKKYELVLYLVELPETPFSGFQFRTIACIHRKVKARPHREGNGDQED